MNSVTEMVPICYFNLIWYDVGGSEMDRLQVLVVLMKLICILMVVTLTLSQDCCTDASVCPVNSTCLCETGVNACMYAISEQEENFTLTSSSINYFYWTPTAEKYSTIDVFFCVNSSPSVNFDIGFEIQNSNGQGYPTNLSTSIPSKGNGCWMMPLIDYEFCTLSNGTYCSLIMGVQLNGAQTFPVQIFVNYVQGAGKVLIPVLISVGVLLMVIIVVLVGCIIKKRMENQQNNMQYKIDNNISHFDLFFPKQTLDQILKSQVQTDEIYNCAVCIIDIERNEICRKTNCGHIFHHECIDIWCKKNINCPMCREPLDLESLNNEEEEDLSLGLVTNKVVGNQEGGNGEKQHVSVRSEMRGGSGGGMEGEINVNGMVMVDNPLSNMSTNRESLINNDHL